MASSLLKDQLLAILFQCVLLGKDAKAALGYLTDDYSVQDRNSTISRWQVEEGLRNDIARTKSISNWTMDLQDIGMRDGALVVVLKENRSAVVTGENGRTRQITARTTMRDTWGKTPAGWKTRRTEIVSGG